MGEISHGSTKTTEAECVERWSSAFAIIFLRFVEERFQHVV